MLKIERELIKYNSIDTGKNVEHHILIANIENKRILLSFPNLFIYNNASSSVATSNRYSSVISKYYKFLSTQEKFKNVGVDKYHVLADNRDIKRWQVSRQIERVKSQSAKPSSESIYNDAKSLLVFFSWLKDAGYPTCTEVKKRDWVANFKSDDLLNYVKREAKVKIDFKNVTVLDKESRQKRTHTLISNQEITWLRESFSDPVYDAMFMLCIGTAMRPIDLCKFPYIGSGSNAHIMPYSDMDQSEKTFDFDVINSKGGKTRKIIINAKDLERLESDYINKYYYERKKLYEAKCGQDCPAHILFLNKFGRPVTPTMVASRGNHAKVNAMENFPKFREGTTFYSARDWWPTMFLIRFFKKELLSESTDALYLAVAEVIRNQMGHEDISTTYKHYIDMARLIVIAHEGRVNELATETYDPVSFIENYQELLD
ncbi:MAG: hypothetical protein ABJD02_20820 [Paraglaciecola sp.]|uniref:hypothetical protein n=1 Tax=Paraglaciecola sp. TaxID=1920173 RepID=UPI003265E4D9